MKKLVFAVLPVLCLTGWCARLFTQTSANVSTAPGSYPTSGQVTCTASPILLYSTTAFGSPSTMSIMNPFDVLNFIIRYQ